ncbi:STAS/SEC14 domain-containing protein [Mesorhizobium sp. BAC0120]|uniref:STAS/SEC14 domain-containing protein n=1 Tax=Mesorhizobium sp. BAC0120 TaxID=3090670 RepID=UPI00298CFF88|nr:STAS/SEC14 domain-containing protein [Mesorhizobium sp. BAC0120]MDW6020670.1 STAS/SEC14 domain-containing protein [Mesorhizobium sp. BAC0120]
MHLTATVPLPPIRRIETSRDDLCALEIAGRITAPDVENAYGLIEGEFAQHDEIDLLVRIADYGGVDWSTGANLDILRRKLRAIGHIRHYALVGGPFWLRGITALSAPFMSMEIRRFALEDEDAAWKWLKARPLEMT